MAFTFVIQLLFNRGRASGVKSIRWITNNLLLFVLLAPIINCSTIRRGGTAETSFTGDSHAASGRKVSQAELQEDLLRFESQFNARVENADRLLESSPDPKIRYRALSNRLIYNTNSLGIATGPGPETNLLDMVAFIELSRDVLESHWMPMVFGAKGKPLVRAFQESAAQIWGIASKVLSPTQKQVLEDAIHQWRKRHADQVNVETVRLSSFSSEAGMKAGELERSVGGLFASVQGATVSADAARLFAERALYYSERAPVLLRLAAKLSVHDMINEASASLAALPNPFGHEKATKDLLAETQKTLMITQATLKDMNATLDSVNTLTRQQVAHPQASRDTTETVTQLAALFREWNQLISSPSYQSGVSRMTDIAHQVELRSNRFLKRLAWLGVGLIALFWLMSLLSKLVYHAVTVRRTARHEAQSHEDHEEKKGRAA